MPDYVNHTRLALCMHPCAPTQQQATTQSQRIRELSGSKQYGTVHSDPKQHHLPFNLRLSNIQYLIATMKSIQHKKGESDEENLNDMTEHQMRLAVDEFIQTEITETLAQSHLQEKVIDDSGPVPPLIFKYLLIAIGLCGILIGIVLGAIIGQRLLAASAVEDMPNQHYAPSIAPSIAPSNAPSITPSIAPSIAPLDNFQPHAASHDPTLEPTFVNTNVSTNLSAHPTQITSYPPTLSSTEYTESPLAPTPTPTTNTTTVP
jgi:hypothetical protein